MGEKMENKAHEWLYIMIWVLGGHPGNMFLSHDKNQFRRCEAAHLFYTAEPP